MYLPQLATVSYSADIRYKTSAVGLHVCKEGNLCICILFRENIGLTVGLDCFQDFNGFCFYPLD